MKLIRYDYPLSTNWSGFGALFGRPLNRRLGAFDHLFDLAEGVASHSVSENVAADFYEDEDHYYARVEMPGVKKSEIEVSLDDRLLSFGDRRSSGSESEGDVPTGRQPHLRSLTVPDGIAADNVSAKLEDGVLTVTLPKAEERKPRTIEVK